MSSNTRNGFVLIEAVVALAIIGVFAIALLTTIGAQVRAADRANVLLVARALAQDRMAALQFLDYEELNAIPDSLEAGTFASPFDAYSWTAQVSPVEDEYDLFTAVVTVTANDYGFPLRRMIHRPRPLIEVEG